MGTVANHLRASTDSIVAYNLVYEKALPPFSAESTSDIYLANLLDWSTQHNDVLLGLVILYYCSDSHDRLGNNSVDLHGLRSCFLRELDRRLEVNIVDVVLVQVILLAFHIDMHLGHMQFAIVHESALQNIIRSWNIDNKTVDASRTRIQAILTSAVACAQSQLKLLLD